MAKHDAPASEWAVTIRWGDKEETLVRTARSAAAARYQVYIDIADAYNDLTFREFLRLVLSTRRTAQTAKRSDYAYVRGAYGIDVEVAQGVRFGDRRGVVAQPGEGPYVYVLFDGENHPSPLHPSEVVL